MPKPLPVILIHGFNGTAADWTDSGFVDYLVNQTGLDSDLVHLFHYGFVEKDGQKVYNNQGDIRQISRRLGTTGGEGMVESLCQKNVERGGPGRVVIVAHSMGGLVARYYLSRRRPDAWGTCYHGRVSCLVEIGTPNLGTPWAEIPPLIPRDSWFSRLLAFLEQLPMVQSFPTRDAERLDSALRQRQRRVRAAAFGNPANDGDQSRAWDELQPDSPFLRELNRPGAMPQDLQYHCLYGDIRMVVTIYLWNLVAYRHQVSLGDLLVPVSSARTIPGTASQSHPVVDQQEIALRLSNRAGRAVSTRSVADHLPLAYHSNLLRNPEVHRQVGKILRKAG